MKQSRGPLTGVLGVGALLIAVVGSGVASPAAGADAGRAPAASRSDAGAAANGSAAARCLTWRRSSPTKAYHKGRTAGYSWAWNKVVGPGPPGGSTTRVNRVKEIQCLLDYRGFDNFLSEGGQGGLADSPWGYYNVYTDGDVYRAQSHCEIESDGVVGPATWRCLRRDKHW
jgi:Putative peptidoglycan binding domain